MQSRTRLVFLCVSVLCTTCASTSPLHAADDTASLVEQRDAIVEHVKRDDLSVEEVNDWVDFAEGLKALAKRDLSFGQRIARALRTPWVVFGFLAQAVFMMRFVLQIIASERKRKSYIPVAFWYFSLVGGVMLFVYALQLRDPVFVLGQGLGCLIYSRNLWLIYRSPERHAKLAAATTESGKDLPPHAKA